MPAFKWSNYNAADVAVDGTGAASNTSINALGISGYAYGPEIDNSTLLLPLGDLELALSAAVTAVAPASLTVFLLPNLGSGNYAAASGNPGGGYFAGSTGVVAGSVQFVQVRGIVLPPFKFKLVVQNSLGVAFPASTLSTCKLYRYTEQVL